MPYSPFCAIIKSVTVYAIPANFIISKLFGAVASLHEGLLDVRGFGHQQKYLKMHILQTFVNYIKANNFYLNL